MKASSIVFCVLLLTNPARALDCSGPLSPKSDEFLHCSFQCKTDVECRRFSKSLRRDSMGDCRPHPEEVRDLDSQFPWLEKNMEQIRGRVFYGDLVGGQYGYWLYSRNNTLIIHTTLHFSNFSELSDFHKKRLQDQFDQAARIWQKQNPYPYPIRFAFQIVEDPKRAHIRNVKLMSKTRGPYFKKWNINWSPYTIAHEFGHVLGLDDEYSYLKSHTDGVCEETSFMCKSNSSLAEIKNYHYYMVARRLFCS